MEIKNETLDSLNEEKTTLEEELKTLDSETDKEKISELTEKVNSINDQISSFEEEDVEKLKETNQRLYARAKKAEGFELTDGKWIKKPKPEIKPEPKPFIQPKDSDIDKLLDAKLEKRELESLDISDELKKEVQTYAKVQGVSVKKALNSEYISFLKEKEEKKEKIDNASLGSNRKGTTKKDYSEMKATDFDMTTPEGRKEFDAYRADMRKRLG
jgi:uncharacterized phage infection (PIP) family protein YhgE